ncbi:MAG TPA: polyprenyl synthetase family protein [Chthoniobacterales bacterium]|nr:polyprenyl synthetase family protein [Chthoniobacterales bacterium]
MEVSLRSTAAPLKISPLTRVASVVQPHLDEVSLRIVRQTEAFDPAIEGYINYALDSGGKRLRPLVALLAGAATGRVTNEHLDLAVIVELVHLATLIHDDIIDDAERRRSQPTLNARWGNALSVLLGDSLFAHALDLSTRFDDVDVSRAIARATRDVCSGEIIQTQRRFDLHLAIEEYFRIIELKTATLFAVAAQLGAQLNTAPISQVEALANFGRHLGAAYQIYDDCVDLAGCESATGKTLGTDLRKGKMTLPMLQLLRQASAIDKERYCQLILEGDYVSVSLLLKTSATAAIDESVASGMRRLQQARAQLEDLPESPAAESLQLFADTVGLMLQSLRAQAP